MYTRIRFVAVLLAVAFFTVTASSALDRQSNSDYRARRVALSKLTNGGVVVLFAGVENEDGLSGFRQDNNFFYLTGWSEPGAALIIAPEAEAKNGNAARPYTEILFLPAHNLQYERWTGPKLGPENPYVKEITGFERVDVLDHMRDELVRLQGMHSTIFTDIAEAPEQSASTIPLQWLQRANAFSGGFHDVKQLVGELREKKDAGELDRIRRATDASMAAHRAAMKAMKPGLTEQQIAAIMQFEYTYRGCERSAYSPIVGSGFNSTVLHYSENSKKIDDGDLVVMDVAGEYSMYASDITRTLPSNGKFTNRQREIYDIVLGAQRAAMQAFAVGKSTLTGTGPYSLYRVAKEYIATHGKDLHGAPLDKYFIHGLGHPVGLEVHDVGTNMPIVLDKGMVFTIEPGIYIPEEKLGVRIEDIYYVDGNGQLVDLVESLPHTADEIEAAMKRSATDVH